jgi:hypothetical protein
MITCNKQFFIDRCKERRYSLDDAMPCVVSQDGDEWTIDEDHPAYPRPKGAGTKLKAILKMFFLKSNPGCNCEDRARTMDENGTQWCRDNLDTIVGWLREEANARGLPFIEVVARQTVLQAIYWADAQRQSSPT